MPAMPALLFDVSVILFFGLCAQWLAWRFKAPALPFFLLFGLGLGPVFRILHVDAVSGRDLEPLISLVVAIILFEGSLNLNFRVLRQSGQVILRLLTVGFLAGWAGIALGAHWWLGFSWEMSALLGAILAVTGPTAVMPVLKHIRLDKNLASILQWEALAVDPLGALFAILIFQAVATQTTDLSLGFFLLGLLKTGLTGAGLGLAAAALLSLLMRRYWVAYALQGAAALTALVAVFTAAVWAQGEAAGLVAVVVMGMVLANQKQAAVTHIREFKEHLAVLLVPALFITLAARVTLQDLRMIDWNCLWFLLWMVVLVRPAGVWLSTAGTALAWKERLFLAGMAPRGIVAAAVAGVFALRLQEQHAAQAEAFMPLTLLTVIGTVVIYSLAAVPLSRALGVAWKDQRGVFIYGINAFSRQLALQLQKEGIWCLLADAGEAAVQAAKQDGLNACRCDDIPGDKLFEPPEISKAGYFLALTGNDEANTLAAMHARRHFEQADIYQLPLRAGGPPADPTGLHGRFLFKPGARWDALCQILAGGGRLQARPSGELLSADAGGGPDRPTAIFAVSPGGNLSFPTLDTPLVPAAAGKVYCLLPARTGALNRWKSRLAGFWRRPASRPGDGA